MPDAWVVFIAKHRGTLAKPQKEWSQAETETLWLDLVSSSGIYASLCEYSRRMLSDGDLAEDAVQETLASLSTRLTYRPDKTRGGGVQGWIFRSLHYRLCSILRKKYRNEEGTKDIEQRESERVRRDRRNVVSNQPTVPEFMLDFDKLILRLDSRTREIVRRTFIDGQTDAEIGGALGLSEENVRVIRHRGIQRLRVFVQAARG